MVGEELHKVVGAEVALYPGPFTRVVRAGREKRTWYPSVCACAYIIT